MGNKKISVTQIYAHITISGKVIKKGLKYVQTITIPMKIELIRSYYEDKYDAKG